MSDVIAKQKDDINIKKNKTRKTAEDSFKTHVPEQSQNIEIPAAFDVIPDKHEHY